MLLRDLGPALLLVGDRAEAELVLRQLGKTLPKDLPSRALLLQLLLQDQRQADAAALLAQLQRIEGDDGVLWRAGEAAISIAKARAGDRAQLEHARQRLAEIAQRRSDWATTELLTGALEELEGHTEQAMQTYLKAINLGERQPALVLRVAKWLTEHQRYADASLILRQLEDQMPLPRDHTRLGVEVALFNDDPKWAVAQARKAVPATARDYRDHLWLAQVQWLAGQSWAAEETLRLAVQEAPRVPDVWVALVAHLRAPASPVWRAKPSRKWRRPSLPTASL